MPRRPRLSRHRAITLYDARINLDISTMARQRNELHLKQVEAWKKKNSGLSDKELCLLFINGILAIRRRCLETLSNITVTAVIDRIVYETQDRFVFLSTIESDCEGLHFEKFCKQMGGSNSDDVHCALQELLLELLEVFGRITAEILTKNLHQELMAVTSYTPPIDFQPRTVISLGIEKKKRDQK